VEESVSIAACTAHTGYMTNWAEVVEAVADLPEVTESTWYRTPALTVRGRGFARLCSESEGALMVLCEMAKKKELLASGDPAYFTTESYDGYGAILVDLDRVDPEELRDLLFDAWHLAAPEALHASAPAARREDRTRLD